jgi:hypothetical protein
MKYGVSMRIGRKGLIWMGEMRIFGESLNSGVHLQVITGDAIQEAKITGESEYND